MIVIGFILGILLMLFCFGATALIFATVFILSAVGIGTVLKGKISDKVLIVISFIIASISTYLFYVCC